MSTLKKILIYFVLALYLVTSAGPVTVFANEDNQVFTEETGTASEEDDISEEHEDILTLSGNQAPLNVAPSQTVGDGEVTLTAELTDPSVEWVDGNPVKKARSTNAGITFKYHVTLNLNEETYKSYGENEICITIPKSILKHSSSATGPRTLDTGRTLFEFDTVINEENGFRYVERKDSATGETLIDIYNTRVPASATLQFDVTYQTTVNSYYYKDYKKTDLENCASNPFVVHLNATHGDSTSDLTAVAPAVYINTNATLESVEKKLTSTWTVDTLDGDGDVTGTYLYLLYEFVATVKSEACDVPTQYYSIDFADVFTTKLADINEDGVSDFEYEEIGYRTGSSSRNEADYSSNHLFENRLSDKVYCYYLVKVQKPSTYFADYDPQLE